jgi:hypothetical protein
MKKGHKNEMYNKHRIFTFNRKFTFQLQNTTKRWGAEEIKRFALLHVLLLSSTERVKLGSQVSYYRAYYPIISSYDFRFNLETCGI